MISKNTIHHPVSGFLTTSSIRGNGMMDFEAIAPSFGSAGTGIKGILKTSRVMERVKQCVHKIFNEF
ncbi:MAG: hypothetical protein WD016_12955 [Balneolaceae bacterium]